MWRDKLFYLILQSLEKRPDVQGPQGIQVIFGNYHFAQKEEKTKTKGRNEWIYEKLHYTLICKTTKLTIVKKKKKSWKYYNHSWFNNDDVNYLSNYDLEESTW